MTTSAPADRAGSADRADRAARLGGLLERARAGEQSALDDVVRELNPVLWQVARAQGLGSEDAGDAVQLAWLSLLRRIREIHSPQALTAWLITATRREAWRLRDRARRDLPDGAAVLAAVPDPAPQPPEQVLAGERDRVLWRHLRELPQRCRELLRIVAMVDRPDYTVVAEALGMPRGSIGPTRGRCLAKLRERLLADPAWSAP